MLFFFSCTNTSEPKNEASNSTKKTISSELQNGDLIFQTSQSSQSKAIQIATNSKYSHMGIIYKQDKKLFVYEAVQPVKTTALSQWIKRGKNGHYVVKRLKNASTLLTSSVLQKMKKVGEKYRGKNYDLLFEWSDDKIYCSELVWKIYKEATNIEIGKLQPASTFNLSHPSIQKIIKERYGNAALPTDNQIISPAAMFHSDQLETVISKN